jgi:biotin carboxylase
VEGDPTQRPGSRLLVLGAGPAQLGLLAAARERGIDTIAADRDPSAVGFPLAGRRAIVSAEDEAALERLARAERVGGIVAPGIDWPVAIAARIASRLGLPHPLDPATAALAVSKLRQRERFAEAGVPQPRWALVRDVHERPEVEFPCVVKAPDRQGQRGLTLVRDRSELRDAVRAAIDASRSRTALVEELVDGPEVTVNAFSVDGELQPLTVTDRETAEPPAFGVALAHVFPSLSGESEAVAAAAAAVAALGIAHGPTYTQLRIGADGPRVVEVAARLGGGHDAELCRAALGVDLNGLALAAALGAPVDPDELRVDRRVGGACTRFLVAEPGEIRAVEGVEKARASEGVVAVHVHRGAGRVIEPLRAGSDRAGAVLAVGATREEAVRRAVSAAACVRFDTVDAEALV